MTAKTVYGAYDDGGEAFNAGISRAACPYPVADAKLGDAWRNGWDDSASHASFIASTNKLAN